MQEQPNTFWRVSDEKLHYISLVSYLYRAITAGPQIITKYKQNGRLKAEISSLRVWTSIFMGFEQISAQDPPGPHAKKKETLRKKTPPLFETSMETYL